MDLALHLKCESKADAVNRLKPRTFTGGNGGYDGGMEATWSQGIILQKWWVVLDSNQRPNDKKSTAPPT